VLQISTHHIRGLGTSGVSSTTAIILFSPLVLPLGSCETKFVLVALRMPRREILMEELSPFCLQTCRIFSFTAAIWSHAPFCNTFFDYVSDKCPALPAAPALRLHDKTVVFIRGMPITANDGKTT
jgi:hypothetical protein